MATLLYITSYLNHLLAINFVAIMEACLELLRWRYNK